MVRPHRHESRPHTPRPSSLERLLHRAAANPRFRRRLLADREEAIAASGLRLTPSERTLLLSVTGEHLERLIANTPRPAPRRRFVQAVVGWLAALLGGSVLLGGCGSPDDEPEPSPIRGSQPDPPVATGIRPD